MNDNDKTIEPIPDEFSSYEEAAEFWDTHDTTEYLDVSHVVNVTSELRHRHYEVELEPAIAQTLRMQARSKGVKVSDLVNSLLRQQLVASD